MKTTTIATIAAAAALCAVSPTLAFDWQEEPIQVLPDGSHLYQIGEYWEHLEQQGSTTSFGRAVAANENLLVVGAPYAQAPADEILMGLGAVSVYEYTSGNPTLGPNFAGIILCPQNSWGVDTTTAHFGWSVALWNDYIAIGAADADHKGLSGVGVVYIYDRNDLSSPTQMLSAQAPSTGAHLGWSLAFGHNGDLLAGSPGSNSVLHFERDNTTWNLAGQIDAPAGTMATAQFGASVDSFVGEVLIGAPQDTTGGQSMCGRVSIASFDNGSGNYTITSTFSAPAPAAHMAFGSSVRAGAEGYFVVGAPRGDSIDPGEAYVYRLGQPAPIATLVPELSSQNDYFGCSVAMTTGEFEPPVIAVGSLGASDDGSYSGAVVIFEYSSNTSTFVETHRLNGYLAIDNGTFGEAVAFRNGTEPGMVNGRTLAVGAPGSEVAYSYFSHDPLDDWVNDTRWPTAVRFPDSVDADGWDYDTDYDWPIATDGERLVVSESNAWSNANEVRLYLRTAGDWVHEHTYAAPSTASYNFGFSVAVDNNMVLIGDPDSDNGSGVVYYGVFSDSGGWSTLDTIYRDGSSVYSYGSDVAIELDSGGSGWIAVGEGGNTFDPDATGKVHLSGVASWYTWPYTIWTPDNLNAYDDNPFFGSSLDIDNGRVLIGAPYKAIEGPDGLPCYQGAVYLYEEVIGAGWQNTQYIFNPANAEEDCGSFFGTDGGSFGAAVALTGDVIVIGAPRASASEVLPGSGLVFTHSASDGSAINVLFPMDLQPGDGFGGSVDASGNTIIVGAPGSDFSAVNGGAAWHFAADTGLPSEALMLEAPSNGASLGRDVAISVSGSGQNVELLMVASAIGQDMPNDRLGAVVTFTSGAVANWIDRGSGGPLVFDGNNDNYWSMPPEDAAVLRFSRWLGDAFELWLDEPTTDGASIEVFVADVAFKDNSFASFSVDGDFTVAGPAEVGLSRLEISFLSPFDIWGATDIGGDGVTGSLVVRGTSHVAAHGDLNLHGGASLAVQTSYDDSNPIINCTGDVSLGGTCTVIDAPLSPAIGDRIVLLQATVAPPADQDSFDMVVLPSLPDGMAFQLLYETVPTVQGTVWQVVVEIVDLADLIGFGEGGSYAVNGDPVDMVLTDLNGDGADEICVLFGGSPGELYIFENDGSGGIDQQIIIGVGDGPVDLAAGNIDGASGNDLIVANVISSNLTLLFNDGDFTDGFTEVAFSLTDSPSCLAAINIDGDGLDDLVVGFPDTDADGNGRVELYYGASSLFGGGLAGGGGADVPGNPGTLDPSMEEDQKGQLFYGATNTGQALAGRMASALAGPTLAINSIAVGTGLSGVANGDVDGDGDEDIIVSAEGSDQVIFLLRDGATWTYDAPLYMPMGTDPVRVIAEDLDGDGTIDIAALTTNDVGARVIRVLQNDGNSAWTSIDTADGDNPAIFAAGDVTGNGSVDLITVTAASSLFGPIQEVAVRPVNDTCPGDIDGNGAVNVDDLMALIGQWGNDCEGGQECTADLDGNLTVDVDDLVMLIGVWGPC